MIFGVEGVDPARRSRLIALLDIDLHQRLTTMSDGQRRRVQICMGLLKPYDVRVWLGAVPHKTPGGGRPEA
jgi:CCR4-NOT complex subunit CAF16